MNIPSNTNISSSRAAVVMGTSSLESPDRSWAKPFGPFLYFYFIFFLLDTSATVA